MSLPSDLPGFVTPDSSPLKLKSPPPLEGNKVADFTVVRFLTQLRNAVAHANNDELSLVMKKWAIVKDQHDMPPFIKELFNKMNTVESDHEFFQLCEKNAAQIIRVYEENKSPKSRRLFSDRA